MIRYTKSDLKLVHELPLKKDVPWVSLHELFPGDGKIIEKVKRGAHEEAAGMWACTELGHDWTARRVVDIHNDWLERKQRREEVAV